MKMYETHEKGGEYYRTRRSKKIKFYSVGGRMRVKTRPRGKGKISTTTFAVVAFKAIQI